MSYGSDFSLSFHHLAKWLISVYFRKRPFGLVNTSEFGELVN